ncbi:MAG: hypothetical protein K2P48_04725 [Lachnospiraceae bacterium]|nr:hypothetical protein [Lachnospiraceae bacterium]
MGRPEEFDDYNRSRGELDGSSDPYNGGSYYNPDEGQGMYGNNGYQQNNPYNNSPYSNNRYSKNQYSPLAPPARKNNIPLIIGIVTGIIILFLIAVFALTYRVVSLYVERREKSGRNFEEHEFNDDRQEKRRQSSEQEKDPYDYDYDDYFDDEYRYDDYFDDGYAYDDYFNDDFFYDDYGYGNEYYYGDKPDFDNDQYYTLHDDIKSDLSYSVDFEYYEYDTDKENVEIIVSYPVIKGEKVPNLEHLNSVISEEKNLFKDYFEEEYAGYMDNENGYFSALSSGYVTYMDEEKMSIVFAEYMYTDYYNEAFLYSINIDMENGVILDNENMLNLDDDFSVEFRKKSDLQNGEIAYLTGMTDQEITNYFNSSNIIVFYTPQGMEIGFNYEEGWVTITCKEYEEYLKVF